MTIVSRQYETCSECGGLTKSGIYIRRDPRLVSFPAMRE